MNKCAYYLTLLLMLFHMLNHAHTYTFSQNKVNDKIVSIEQAIAMAFKERPSIRKFHFDILAAHDSSRALLAGYFPQAKVHAGTGNAKLDFFSPKSDLNIYISQLLYSFSGPLQRYQIAEEDVFVLEAQRIAEKNKSRYEIETTMLDLWNTKYKEFAINQYNISSHTTFKRDANQQQVGLLDLVDWMQATATFEYAQAIIKEYADMVTIAHSNAERSIGAGSWDSTIIDTGAIERFIEQAISAAPHYDNTKCFQEALSYRPELVANAHAVQKALYQERFYERSYFPTIGLFLNFVHYVYDKSCTTNSSCNGTSALLASINKFTGWRLGFSFDWAFDGLANIFNATAAEQQSYALTMQRFDLIDQIKKEVTNSHSELTIALKDLHAAKAAYNKAKTQYAAQKIQYGVGLISPVEFETATTYWDKAQIDYTNSKVIVAKKRSELLLACGYPKEDL